MLISAKLQSDFFLISKLTNCAIAKSFSYLINQLD